MSAGAVLLLTRPEAQSRAFLKLCEERMGQSLTSVISPVMRIVPTGPEPDLDAKTVVVTSANAVRVLADRLSGFQVATVGAATAELAQSFGADAVPLGETVDAFLEASSALQPPVVVARGVHARTDLAAELSARGIPARSVTVYDQVTEPITPEAENLLSGSVPIMAPIFSPRSAELLSRRTITAPITVLAISGNAGAVWAGPGDVFIAKRPTAEAMCDLVAEVL